MTSSTTTNGKGTGRRPIAAAAAAADETASRPARLPSPEATVDDSGAELLELRRFHRGQRTTAEAPALDSPLPALLHPVRGVVEVRTDYPLFLAPARPAPADGSPLADRSMLPLRELLEVALAAVETRSGEARILRDNLLRFERAIRAEMPAGPAPVPAGPVLARAAAALRESLGLRGENADRLDADLRTLAEVLPDGGELVGFHPGASVPLLARAVRDRRADRQRRFREEVEKVSVRLRDLLNVERTKDPEARDPEALGSAHGGVGEGYLDLSRLSEGLGPRRGSRAMDPERRERLESLLATLDAHLAADDEPVLILVRGESLPEPPGLGADTTCESSRDPFHDAVERWRREADRLVPVVRALRLAALEARSRYDAERHGPWFESLGRQVFTPEEKALLPVVAVLDRAGDAAQRLAAFSELLLSGAPVQVLLDDPPVADPASPDGDPLGGSRLELGYLGVGHREAFVQQSSPARPDHLLAGFRAALDSARPSLHLLAGRLDETDDAPTLDAWLETGAALEGRAHPFFRYDPTAGSTWASRLDFSGNPAPEEDWPSGSIPAVDADDRETSFETTFTFGDYALLSPALRDHFRPVPDLGESDDLVPLARHLQEPPGEGMTRIPFVWATDRSGRLVRLAVSERLAAACRDRLGWWRTLQELAGVRNEYVREATERARSEAEAAWTAEREKLEADHAAELERVRQEATEEALAGLARSLLDLDASGMSFAPVAGGAAPAAPAAPGAPAPAPEAEPAAEAPAAPEPEEEEELGDDAWVDTPLCTSCNDCVNINPKLFVYDANKQVRIGDPTAGTYEQLVFAAEKCPARCIHPGAPRNPDEPNLDALIERAKPFR
jgi:ferredoxin